MYRYHVMCVSIIAILFPLIIFHYFLTFSVLNSEKLTHIKHIKQTDSKFNFLFHFFIYIWQQSQYNLLNDIIIRQPYQTL